MNKVVHMMNKVVSIEGNNLNLLGKKVKLVVPICKICGEKDVASFSKKKQTLGASAECKACVTNRDIILVKKPIATRAILKICSKCATSEPNQFSNSFSKTGLCKGCMIINHDSRLHIAIDPISSEQNQTIDKNAKKRKCDNLSHPICKICGTQDITKFSKRKKKLGANAECFVCCSPTKKKPCSNADTSMAATMVADVSTSPVPAPRPPRICQSCASTEVSDFAKSFRETGLCKKCNHKRRLERRNKILEDSKTNKEQFKTLIATLPIFELDENVSRLLLVDSAKSVAYMRSVLEVCRVVGVDTETLPQFVKGGSSHPTALLQIATSGIRVTKDGKSPLNPFEHVFLVDLYTISRNHALFSTLCGVLSSLFGDHGVLKVSQGLARDILLLVRAYSNHFFASSIPTSSSSSISISKDIVTLSPLVELSDIHFGILGSRALSKQDLSLQRLTQLYLGQHLMKSKRVTLSNWHMRPLSSQQLHYAACDALVLLRLFDAMKSSLVKSSLASTSSHVDSSEASETSHPPTEMAIEMGAYMRSIQYRWDSKSSSVLHDTLPFTLS